MKFSNLAFTAALVWAGTAHAALPWRPVISPPGGRLAHLLATVPAPAGGNGVAYARQLLAVLRAHGYPAEHLTILEKSHEVFVAPAVFPSGATSGQGWISGYLPPAGTPVTRQALTRASRFLAPAALARNEHLNIRLPQSGPAQISAVPSGAPAFGGGLLMISSGPRYAGSDVATAYGWAHVDGTDINASLTRGLPGLTPKQASGGHYVGESLDIDHPTPWGTLTASLSHAHYLTGGPTLPLMIKGTVTQFEAGWRYPVAAGATLYAGVLHVHQIEELGVVGWASHQDTTALHATATWSHQFGEVRVGVHGALLHGLAGEGGASTGPVSLLGLYSNNFTIERGRASLTAPAGPGLISIRFGGQRGPAGTPAALQAYIGGPGRGDSLFTGAYAAPSGAWSSATYTLDDILPASWRGTLQPYLSASDGTVWPAIGKPQTIASIGFGVTGRLSHRLSYRAGLAHTLTAPAGADMRNRFVFLINASF